METSCCDLMNRSDDDIRLTTESGSETDGEVTDAVKIYALHGAQTDAAHEKQETGGQAARIIAFGAPAEPAAPDEEAPEDAPAAAPDDAPLPDNVDVISREKLEQQTFEESTDFFDEVPHRVVGVISSKEIEEAEDYDVFVEAEQPDGGADVPEPPEKDETIRGLVKNIFAGIKRFFVHLGYFITNIKHGVQRKRAADKRRRTEKQRARRAAEQRRRRQEDMESRRDRNGLVQVRRRRERRDNDKR